MNHSKIILAKDDSVQRMLSKMQAVSFIMTWGV